MDEAIATIDAHKARRQFHTPIAIALLLGLVGPSLFAAWFSQDVTRKSVIATTEAELEHLVHTLADGMREPIWNLIPESGEPLVESLSSNPHIVSVEVTSRAQGEFLSFHREAASVERLVQRTLAVKRDGTKIGEVTIEIDFSAAEGNAASSLRPLVLVAAIQLLVALGAVLFIYRVSGRLERERALRIANGQLKLEIAERERVEAALLESEVRLKSVIDFFPAAICFKDIEGRFVRVNRIYENWLNLEESECLGKKTTEYISDDYIDLFEYHHRKVLETQEIVEEEHLIV